MSYQDPWQARRAAREARRAARYAFWTQRRMDRYAYRNARRDYRYRYGRPGGGIVGMVFLVLLFAFVFTHVLVWLFTGLAAVLVAVIILALLRRSMAGNSFMGPQQSYPPYQQQQPPEQSYQPYEQQQSPPEQTYSSYEQGYAATPPQGSAQEPVPPYSYPPQAQPRSNPSNAQYEEPSVQYPQELPPMEQ